MEGSLLFLSGTKQSKIDNNCSNSNFGNNGGGVGDCGGDVFGGDGRGRGRRCG